MKRVIMLLAFVVSLAGAAFTTNEPVSTDLDSITLYRPIANCPTVECTNTATLYACTDLKTSCNGASYTGAFKRNIP